MKAFILCALLALLFFGSLSAADRGGDITPPVLVAASADRLQIDTSNGPETITFTLHITDDLSGVRGIQLNFRHELGYNEGRDCQQWPNSGQRDAFVQCVATWPQYSAEGKWIVTWVWMQDGVGNADGCSVANCTVVKPNGMCSRWEYNDAASDAIRSIEVQIGPAAPGEDPPLYLPLVIG